MERRQLLLAALAAGASLPTAAGAGAPCRLLVYGDSNTWGWRPTVTGEPLARYPDAVRWPGVLQTQLGRACQVEVQGLMARTLDSDEGPGPFGLSGEDLHGLKRLPLALLSARPVHLLVVMLGTNDMMTRLHRSPAEVAGGIPSLRDIARQGLVSHPRVRAPGVLLVAPPPLGDTGHALFSDTFDADAQARSRDLPARLHDAAQAAGIPFLAASQAIHTDGVDGVHLSAQAHHRLGVAVARAVQPLLLRV